MIPLRDHNPSGKTPIVTYSLITINVLIFLSSFLMTEEALLAFYDQYAITPALISQGQNLYTLITAMFLHGGIGHIFGNMLFLYIFGDNLEDKLGHVKYLLYYLVCGLGASALQILIDPSSTIPNLGASGAIAGVMGGYLLLFPQHKVDVLFSFGFSVRKATLPAYTMLFYWFLMQFLSGVGSLAYIDQMTGGVAYFAHIGGFLTGLVLIMPVKKSVKFAKIKKSKK